MPSTCSVEGCDRPSSARGWCVLHYHRWYYKGDVAAGHPDEQQRFWAKVKVHAEVCWEWTAGTNQYGYGRFRLTGPRGKAKKAAAHRYAYELLVGPIPDGLQLDHLCRNPACVRPDHLEPVTPSENVRRGAGIAAKHARKTHCVNGHELTAENVYPNAKGWRICRVCNLQRTRAS